MMDERIRLVLRVATPKMRKPILEFAARRFRLTSVQVFFDAHNEFGREVLVEFVAPNDGLAFVVRQDGSVTES